VLLFELLAGPRTTGGIFGVIRISRVEMIALDEVAMKSSRLVLLRLLELLGLAQLSYYSSCWRAHREQKYFRGKGSGESDRGSERSQTERGKESDWGRSETEKKGR
jgi:hypothetical protein